MTGEVVNIIKMFTQSNSVRGGLSVEPEPDPGENNNESAGQIHLAVIMRSIDRRDIEGPVAPG